MYPYRQNISKEGSEQASTTVLVLHFCDSFTALVVFNNTSSTENRQVLLLHGSRGCSSAVVCFLPVLR